MLSSAISTAAATAAAAIALVSFGPASVTAQSTEVSSSQCQSLSRRARRDYTQLTLLPLQSGVSALADGVPLAPRLVVSRTLVFSIATAAGTHIMTGSYMH